MENGEYVQGSLFYYAPNQGAPAFFAAAFAVSCAVHIWQCYHYRCFGLTWLLAACTLLFAVGFAVREYCSFHFDNIGAFVASGFLIYIVPPLLELANYHILGRILYYVPYLSPIHPGRVLSTFMFLSAIVEVLSALGVSASLNPRAAASKLSTGRALLQASLLLQIVFAACFVFLAAFFHHRCRKNGIKSRNVTAPLSVLYASTALISVRTIYRIIEFWALVSGDPDNISPVVRYEWFFYVFEATIMLLDCVLFNIFHPRRWLPKSNKIYLARDGVTEIEGPGWQDKRPWIVTLCDPFDFIGMLTPKKNFWDEQPDVERNTHAVDQHNLGAISASTTTNK